MNIDLKPDKKLFLAFLFINAAGYNKENNPKGMHPLRIHLSQQFSDLTKTNEQIKQTLGSLKEIRLPQNQMVRLVNLIIQPDIVTKDLSLTNSIDSRISRFLKSSAQKIDSVVSSDDLTHLFDQYNHELSKLKDYNQSQTDQTIQDVLSLFNIQKAPKITIKVHINLLESFSRGTNYYHTDPKIISASLDFNERISWQTIRHEFAHILLKEIFKDDLSKTEIKVPVSKDYQQDDLRAQFDENFVIATTLHFLDPKSKSDNLRFYEDHGFPKIRKFDEFIQDTFIKEKQELSSKTITKLIKTI